MVIASLIVVNLGAGAFAVARQPASKHTSTSASSSDGSAASETPAPIVAMDPMLAIESQLGKTQDAGEAMLKTLNTCKKKLYPMRCMQLTVGAWGGKVRAAEAQIALIVMPKAVSVERDDLIRKIDAWAVAIEKMRDSLAIGHTEKEILANGSRGDAAEQRIYTSLDNLRQALVVAGSGVDSGSDTTSISTQAT